MERIQLQFQESGIEITIKDISTKMHSLRVYYSATRNKLEASKVSGTCSSQVYKVKWVYYQNLHFLKDFLQPKDTASNLTRQSFNEQTGNEEDINEEESSSSLAPKSKKSHIQKEKANNADIDFLKTASACVNDLRDRKVNGNAEKINKK